MTSPSYITKIEEIDLALEDIDIHYMHGKRSGVYFTENNIKYFAFCRNLFDKNDHNFCNNSFPTHADNLKVTLILKGLYSNSENLVIINEANFEKNPDKDFYISNSEYENSFNFIKNKQYFIRFIIIISFLILLLFFSKQKFFN